MIYLAIFSLIFAALALSALVLRFIQPELIYSIRQTLVKIKTNKAFLDYDANRFTSAQTFPDLLMKDFRYETRDYDERYVLQRVMKIRELYRILDLRRPPIPGLGKKRKPQVCVIELASLIGNLGRHVSPDRKYNYSTIAAHSILTFIGNEIRRQRNEPPLANEKEVEAWFTQHPVSIEQVVEILSAAVFGLAYRQRVQRSDEEQPPVSIALNLIRSNAKLPPPQNKSFDKTAEAKVTQTSKFDGTHAQALPYGPGIQIFVACSAQDGSYLGNNSLLGALKVLEKEGLQFWHDEAIAAGGKWDDEVKHHISTSRIAILLVSQTFLDSAYCRKPEITLFLKQAEAQGLIILPIVLSRCEWQRNEWLKHRTLLPAENKTIEDYLSSRRKRKKLFTSLRENVRSQVKELS